MAMITTVIKKGIIMRQDSTLPGKVSAAAVMSHSSGGKGKRTVARGLLPKELGVILFLMAMMMIMNLLIQIQIPEDSKMEIPNSLPGLKAKKRKKRPKHKSSLQNNSTEWSWDCLKPRSFDVAKYLQENELSALPKPWIHIGMPKTGTTTLEKFWKCGLNQQHFDDFVSHSTCKVSSETLRTKAFNGSGIPSDPHASCPSKRIRPCELCGWCMNQAKNLSLPLLESCGNYTAWAQMDSEEACYFPQLSALDLIHKEAPQATFVFMLRDIDKWVHSVENFKKGAMKRRLKRCQFPYWTGNEHLKEWFCEVVNHARRFVAEHPTHSYVEIDLDDPSSSQFASTAFGISESCWGMHNVNAKIHGNISSTGNNVRGIG
jgi:hypothetical protein